MLFGQISSARISVTNIDMATLTAEKIRENIRFRKKVQNGEVYLLWDDHNDGIPMVLYNDGRPVTPGQDLNLTEGQQFRVDPRIKSDRERETLELPVPFPHPVEPPAPTLDETTAAGPVPNAAAPRILRPIPIPGRGEKVKQKSQRPTKRARRQLDARNPAPQ